VFDATGYALLSVALATSLFHTLIPDHWLPFVLVGRARGWSVAHTVAVAGSSALIHAALSVLLGLLALAVGMTAAQAIGETLETAGPVLLIVFGVVYAGWAWRKGGHFHPGGERLHAAVGGVVCDGHEGDGNPEHLHYHADDALIREPSGVSAWWLALIVGVNPCVLVLPIIFTAAGRGPTWVALVCAAYSVPTILLMVGVSALGVGGSRRLRLPVAARYMEMASGLLIALLGAAVLLLPHGFHA
jgi:hypothetical protein